MTTALLTGRLKAEALRLGFDRVGVAPAVSPPGYGHFQEWLKAGHGAGMSYLQKHEQIRSHPDHLLDGVRSVVMTSLVYGEPRTRADAARRKGKSLVTPVGLIIIAFSGTSSKRC